MNDLPFKDIKEQTDKSTNKKKYMNRIKENVNRIRMNK